MGFEENKHPRDHGKFSSGGGHSEAHDSDEVSGHFSFDDDEPAHEEPKKNPHDEAHHASGAASGHTNAAKHRTEMANDRASHEGNRAAQSYHQDAAKAHKDAAGKHAEAAQKWRKVGKESTAKAHDDAAAAHSSAAAHHTARAGGATAKPPAKGASKGKSLDAEIASLTPAERLSLEVSIAELEASNLAIAVGLRERGIKV